MFDSHPYVLTMMTDELMAEWDCVAGLARLPGPLHIQFIKEPQAVPYFRGGVLSVTGPVFTYMDIV